MPSVDVVVKSKVTATSRIKQLSAVFDCPIEQMQTLEWHVNLPYEEFPWDVGLIVGPSGCGKSQIARKLFGASEVDKTVAWSDVGAVIDDFATSLSMEQITDACMAVGFNTIPAWMRPHNVLSNGERFRVELARRLLESGDTVVIDEFTSVVDRQVAKIASHAVQKFVRKKNEGKKFVGVTCHYDVIDWLQPDWVFDPSTSTFTRRERRRRPELNIEICGVPYAAWDIFAPFHYLTRDLSAAAKCYGLWVDGQFAAFVAILHRPNSSTGEINTFGISRVVVLPDFQGLGLSFVLTEFIGAAYAAVGKKLNNYPAHPTYIHSMMRSPNWKLLKKPSYQAGSASIALHKSSLATSTFSSANKPGGFGKRPCAIFEYIGPSMNRAEAEKLLSYHGRTPGVTYRHATTRGAKNAK